MPTRIIFNGREYSTPEEMPDDVRKAYDQALAQLADADRDGVPDVIERGAPGRHVLGIQHSSITVNGRTYENPEQMPPLVRRLYEEAMAQVDRNRDGIPDAIQGGSARADPDVNAHVFQREFTWSPGASGRIEGRRPAEPTRPGLLLLALGAIGLLALLYLLL